MYLQNVDFAEDVFFKGIECWMISSFKTYFMGKTWQFCVQALAFVALCASLSVLSSGCTVFEGDSAAKANQGSSLTSFIENAMPLPGATAGAANVSTGGTRSENDTQDTKVRFVDGEPLLRTGYIIRIMVAVGDKVEVSPIEVQVSDKNEITLPLVGKVDCDGLTINGLKGRLTTRYSEFFRNPEVSTSFVIKDAFTSPWGRVHVSGRVHREGWISIPATRCLTVSDAVQAAGGCTAYANKSRVIVNRPQEDGSVKSFKINLEEIGKKGKTENDMLLKSGDTVFVPESSI